MAQKIIKWNASTAFPHLFKSITLYQLKENNLFAYQWLGSQFEETSSRMIDLSSDDLYGLNNQKKIFTPELRTFFSLKNNPLYSLNFYSSLNDDNRFFLQLIIDESVFVTQFLPTIIESESSDFQFRIKNYFTNTTLFRSSKKFTFDTSSLNFSFNFLSENNNFFALLNIFQKVFSSNKSRQYSIEQTRLPYDTYYEKLRSSFLAYPLDFYELQVAHKNGSLQSVILKKAMPSIVLACIILLVLLIGSFFLVHYITNMQYFSNRQQEFI
ncbi:MAG: hypothetical protein ACRC5H_08860, partial [Treponemataceae bacterium]